MKEKIVHVNEYFNYNMQVPNLVIEEKYYFYISFLCALYGCWCDKYFSTIYEANKFFQVKFLSDDFIICKSFMHTL